MRETFIDKGCCLFQNSIQTIGGIVIALINNWMEILESVAYVPLIVMFLLFDGKITEKICDQDSKSFRANTNFDKEINSQF
jgi:hypothetical protein